ncbi:DUF998 domain-containing protein [Umezawaea endophytica]|uniref:DUF998 domain-containing protein n=1 Tax=Umezawaea endophytica TaxID=1654476 RepID=A0A9X2VUD5_9PSEU|nr:DUF998 domain-containing protein [Umezawaea endophytica]MCS7482900.1 DUF998 domain-containing protein [Umezawaea endophytica]
MTTAHLAAPATWRTRLGGSLFALGTVQFFVVHVVVQNAWNHPRYSWWANYISDLGAVRCAPVLGNDVCSPLHAGMNTAFVLQGVFLLAGVILTADAWATKGNRRIWQGMVGLAGASWITIGLVPEDVNLTVHSVGALPIFILGNIALVVAGSSASTSNRPVARASAMVLGVIGLAGFALTILAVANPGGAIGVGFAERVTVFPLQIWALVAGFGFLVRAGDRPSR